MPPEHARPTGGYLLGLLADGAAAFAPRTGVHRLLGAPAAEAGGASFLPPLPPVGFQYAAWGGGAAPGPGAPGSALSAPLGPPASRAELSAPPRAARPAPPHDGWDTGDDDVRRPASSSASAPALRGDAPRPGSPAPSAAPIERNMQTKETNHAEDAHPASPRPRAEAPRPAEPLPAQRGPAQAGTAPVDAVSPTAAKRAEDRPAGEGTAGLAPEPKAPARTVGLTIPGVSGPREILAALAQRQASQPKTSPDALRAPSASASTAETRAVEGQGIDTDAAHPAPRRPSAGHGLSAGDRHAAAHLLPARKAEGGMEAEARAEAVHPVARRSSAALSHPAEERVRPAGRGGEAEVEQLRRATAARARQAAPPREEPAAAVPAPAPVVVQAPPQPVVLVQAAAGPEAYAPRAFLASSLLRGAHLRVLR